MESKSKKAQQSVATRQVLVAAARQLFAELGFAATGTEQIVAKAGVTRGALYHQFADKRDLFEAVFRQLEAELVGRMVAALDPADDPLTQLQKGAARFLEECLDPEIRRISLIDAPSVLGWQRWREVELDFGLGLIAGSLTRAMDAGAIARRPVEPLAHVLLGALIEAGLLMAGSKNTDEMRAELTATFDALLGGLADST
jgi:AcrR family transcriptional regulator